MARIQFFIICFFIFSGCASLHPNPPLKQVGDPSGYSFNNLLAEGNEIGDNMVILAFSGGGTRAAAFGYGVAKYLDQVELQSGGSLLDETKIITSVSGGSFASSYYGLYGKEKFLKEFPDDVLNQKLSTQLLRNLMRFARWVPIAVSGDLGKSDLAQALYDKEIFHHKTFADMPRKWPFIIINGADMTKGTPFSFIQEDFNLLCSDLNGVAVSRAVVSSSAFPGPFTPLSFKNYPKDQCGYQTPQWAKEALASHPEKNLQNYLWAKTLNSYVDGNRRYVHVFDGGIADNLGLRSILYHFRSGEWNVLNEKKSFKAKRIILFVVNAKPSGSDKVDSKAKIPKLFSVLMNAASKPMENYTTKTVEEFIMRFDETRKAGENFKVHCELCDQVYADSSARENCYAQYQFPFGGIQKPPYPDVYLIHAFFDSVPDPELRETVSQIETDLQLSKSKIDALILAAQESLKASPEFQKLVKDLNATIKKN